MDKSALAPLDRWLSHVIGQISPAARRPLLRTIITELRKRNRVRMAVETGPDGEKWTPRQRDSQGRVRSKAKMMEKLRSNRQMLIQANADGADLGWSGAAARISLVHHLGQVGEVEKGGARVKYPARPLIGLPPEDVAYVRDAVLDHLKVINK